MTTIDNKTDFKVNIVELGKYVIAIGSIATIVFQHINSQQRIDDRQTARIEILEQHKTETKEELKAIRLEMKEGFSELNNKLDQEKSIILTHKYLPQEAIQNK